MTSIQNRAGVYELVSYTLVITFAMSRGPAMKGWKYLQVLILLVSSRHSSILA